MCRISNELSRIIAVCDSQQQSASTTTSSTSSNGNKSKYFTVTFRSFTPQPLGLEFKPGQDYYFISTLAGNHSDSEKRFSPCKEHNMKVIFKVCCKSPPSSNPANSGPLVQSADLSTSSARTLNNNNNNKHQPVVGANNNGITAQLLTPVNSSPNSAPNTTRLSSHQRLVPSAIGAPPAPVGLDEEQLEQQVDNLRHKLLISGHQQDGQQYLASTMPSNQILTRDQQKPPFIIDQLTQSGK